MTTNITTTIGNSMTPRRGRSSSRSVFFFQQSILLSAILVAAMQHGVHAFSSPFLTASRPSLLSNPKSISCPSRLGAGGSSIDDDDEREREFARVRRRRSRYEDDDGYETEGVMDAADMLEDEGFFDDIEDYDDDDDFEDDESNEILSNTVIPNSILDSIDPDGAAERFPELVADPRFWFDMFLFINFLNFISFIGPRNPFPDMIPAMYTAGLPPPGM